MLLVEKACALLEEAVQSRQNQFVVMSVNSNVFTAQITDPVNAIFKERPFVGIISFEQITEKSVNTDGQEAIAATGVVVCLTKVNETEECLCIDSEQEMKQWLQSFIPETGT
jgi:hypothetical protein